MLVVTETKLKDGREGGVKFGGKIYFCKSFTTCKNCDAFGPETEHKEKEGEPIWWKLSEGHEIIHLIVDLTAQFGDVNPITQQFSEVMGHFDAAAVNENRECMLVKRNMQNNEEVDSYRESGWSLAYGRLC